jgi:hypothetical protein
MKTTTQKQPATLRLGRRFLQVTAALGAVFLVGTPAFAGPNQVWASTVGLVGGASLSPSPRVLAIDATGASYVFGYGDAGPGTPAAAYITKVDSAGNPVWVSGLSALGVSSQAQFNDGLIDPNGELIVTGFIDEAATPSTWVTVKVDPATGAGSATWPDVGDGVGVRVVSHPLGDYKGWRLIPDSIFPGGVYVSGTDNFSLMMVRFDPTGNRSAFWPDIGFGPGIRMYLPPGGVDLNSPAILKTDSSGNLYLAGTGVAGSLGLDYIATKFNAAGTLLWDSSYSTGSAGTDRVFDMTLDANGNCFVTGESFDVPNSQTEMAVVRFNTGGGGTAWATRTTGAASGRRVLVAPGAGGAVYVAGKSDTNNTMNVWRYNSAGAPATGAWPAAGGSPAGVRRLGGIIGDQGEDILLDNGQLYVTGKVWDSGVQKMTTWNINATNGNTGWIERFGAVGAETSGVAIKILGSTLIGAGFTRSTGGGPDSQVVIQYTP